MIYPALEKAGIIYSEDQIEHCSEDNFKAGFNAAIALMEEHQVKPLRDALEFYADRKHHPTVEFGSTARTALAKAEE